MPVPTIAAIKVTALGGGRAGTCLQFPGNGRRCDHWSDGSVIGNYAGGWRHPEVVSISWRRKGETIDLYGRKVKWKKAYEIGLVGKWSCIIESA